MSINIPDRTLNNPNLSLQEINQILQQLRGLPTSRRYEESSYGTTILPDNPYVGTINIKFDAALPSFSIFTIKFVNRQFYAPIATADWDIDTAPSEVIPGKGLVYCTNENNLVVDGSVMDCKVIGDDLPKLIHYTGTLPVLGDRLRKKSNDYVLEKAEDGAFVAVSAADATRGLVWVVRMYDVPASQQVLTLLRARDWMDVGSAVGVQVWNNTLGDWATDDEQAIAQDVQHRSFLCPDDQVWGKLLGYTEDEAPIYEIIGENGLHQWGKALDVVTCGNEGQFEITLANPDSDPVTQNILFDQEYATYLPARVALRTDPGCPTDINRHTVTACTPKKGCVRQIFATEYAPLRYIVANRKWEARPVPDTLFARGTLYAEMCPDDPGTITGLTPVGCCVGVTATIPDGIALNAADFNLAGRTGYRVFAVYLGTGNDWSILQVQHEEIEIVEKLFGGEGDCPSLLKEVRKFALMTCVPTPDQTTLLESGPVDVITGLAANGCYLDVITTEMCVLGVGASALVPIALSTVEVDVVTSFASGLDPSENCNVLANTRKIKVCSAEAESEVQLTVLDGQLVDIVTGLTVNGCDVSAATGKACLIGFVADEEPTEIITTVDAEVIVSVEFTDSGSGSSSEADTACAFVAKTKTIKVCSISAEVTTEHVMFFQSQVVLRDIVDTGDDILGCFVEIFTPCIGDDWCEPILETDPCEDDASSSGG